jgi:hypothetical protein
MIKLNKNTLDKNLFSDLENFRFKEGTWGPWDSILDAIPDSDKCKKISQKIINNKYSCTPIFQKISKKSRRNSYWYKL